MHSQLQRGPPNIVGLTPFTSSERTCVHTVLLWMLCDWTGAVQDLGKLRHLGGGRKANGGGQDVVTQPPPFQVPFRLALPTMSILRRVHVGAHLVLLAVDPYMSV